MANCKNCGYQLNDNATFCGKCGAAVGTVENTSVCTNCGNIIQSGIIFCDKCGQRVELQKSQPRPEPTPAAVPYPVVPASAPIPRPTPANNSLKNYVIWAIVLAFLAPIIAWSWYDAFGLVLSAVSLIIGIKSRKGVAILFGVLSVVIVVSMFIYAYA